MKLQDRIEIARNVIWEVSSYHDVLEHMSYDLDGIPSPIEQNEGAFFVWRSIAGLEILALSKLINDNGPFSLQKLVNIASASIKGFKKDEFQADLDQLSDEYKRYQVDVIRDKFIAHLDIIHSELGIDIHKLSILKNWVASFFNRLATVLEVQGYVHDLRVISSLAKIFDKHDS